MKRTILLLLSAGLLMAAAPSSTSSPPDYTDQFVDRSVDPRVDFFHFAVGKWIKDHPIPANESSWGVGKVVQEETYQRLLALSQEASREKAAPGSNAQKIGDFWYAAMDTATNAKQGFTPLKAEFDRIAAIHDQASLLSETAHLQYIGVSVMCSLPISQDEKHSDRFAVHLYQGGIGLPDRDYYFDEGERPETIRREYVTHVGRMFELLGDAPATAKKNAATVMSIETELAKASRKLEDLRDPIANYNKMSTDAVSKLTPSIQWRTFLNDQKIHDLDSVIVGQPEFYQQLEKSLHSRSLDEWKTYLRWSLVNTFALQAGGKFDEQNFRFFGTILNGTPKQRARWKRMLDQEENYLGDALGQIYVAKYFSPRTRERYETMIDNIFAAYAERIRKVDWMSEETKQRALVKLAAVTKKYGYPQHWKDYSNYQVDRSSFLMNCVRGNMWFSDFYIAKLYKPVDRTEWSMTPQTYNAYYLPTNNEIVLPAAAFILPGIADSLVDDAIVYGYAGGTTIGHEITHGFDDQGRQFDDKGNLQNWWTPKDESEFKRRAERIVKQYSDYIAVNDLHVNGEATQGENIADLGGIQLGWDAFTKTEEYKSGRVRGGLTPAQRYFIGWALGWMNNIRPEALAVRVKSDVHAPSFLRVIGPVTNLPEFYAAYGVKPGDKMYRDDSVRVKIW
jgi:putative endopeptidase